MNYLITGGTGFLGSHLVKKLKKNKGNNIVVTTSSIRKKTSLSMLEIDEHNVSIVECDLRDFEKLKMIFNEYEFDYIFHLGAISEVRKCQTDPKLAYEVNVQGTNNVLECARLYANPKAIAVSSSDKAYGDGEVPYVETQRLAGKSIYEVSKVCADMISLSYFNNFNLPVFTTRCCNIYGEADANFSRIIPNSIIKLNRGESPVIYKGNSESTREFIYVEDVVSAYLELAKNIDVTKGNSYNIGSGDIYSVENIVSLLIEKINKDISISYLQKDFPEISHQYLNSEKIKNDIKWVSKTSFLQGIEKTIAFYKKYKF